jgi:hypothetical protein
MRRVAAIFAVGLLLLGVVLLIQAANTPRYTDPAAFQRGVDALSATQSEAFSTQSDKLPKDPDSMSSAEVTAFHAHMRSFSAEQHRKYQALLDTYGTNKHKLEDYGGTALVLGAALLLAGPLGSRTMKTPSRRGIMLVLMFTPPLLSFAAFVFDSWRWVGRVEAVPWGEVPGAALMLGVFLFGLTPVIWMSLHLLLVPEVYYRRQPLLIAWSLRTNPWLAFLSVLAASVTVLVTWHGMWWWTIAGLSWVFVYLCMAASRRACHLFADQETEWPPAWNTR